MANPWPSNSRSNWNLEMLIFVEGGKPENPERDPRSKDENQQQTQPTYDTGSVNFLLSAPSSLIILLSVARKVPSPPPSFPSPFLYTSKKPKNRLAGYILIVPISVDVNLQTHTLLIKVAVLAFRPSNSVSKQSAPPYPPCKRV